MYCRKRPIPPTHSPSTLLTVVITNNKINQLNQVFVVGWVIRSLVPSSTETPASGSSSIGGGLSGACTEEGMFTCIGVQRRRCTAGSWTPMQAMPATTKSKEGPVRHPLGHPPAFFAAPLFTKRF
ncbi:hypothetical protein CIB48_g5976 [Xylaria polymorpha]|nr:hypothetical protein CIB48_g5976 [Xylaria polymorpha]